MSGGSFYARALAVEQRALKLPQHFEAVTLNGIKRDPVREMVRQYLANFWTEAERGIAPVISGKVGTYKTYAACVIARFVYEIAGITVEFFDTPSEIPALDRGWYDGSAQKRLSQLATAPLLIVDDFNRLRETGRDKAIMDEIGTLRYNGGFPTIWTGNIDMSPTVKSTKVAELISEPFARRLVERSAGYRLSVRD